MKTPLSFLARLMARGRATETHSSFVSPAGTIEVSKAEDHALATLSSSHAPIVATETAPDDVVPAAEPAMEDIDAAVEAPSEDVVTIEPVNEALTTKSRARRATHVKAERADAAAIANDENGQRPTPVVSFPSEEESLDAEIAALRSQLAQKLRLQNAQLKKRLARFDRA